MHIKHCPVGEEGFYVHNECAPRRHNGFLSISTMEKSSIRTHENLHTVRDSTSRKPVVGINRLSSEVNREKSEICVSAKEKTPDLNSQQSIRGNFADFMKFGPVYGSVPPQYFDQFSGICLYEICLRDKVDMYYNNTHPIYMSRIFCGLFLNLSV